MLDPFFVKSNSEEERNVWICLLTYCSTSAIHFKVVPNITSEAFVRCFSRFVPRRSRPSSVVSVNAKTFKSASEELEKISVFLRAAPRKYQLHVEIVKK